MPSDIKQLRSLLGGLTPYRNFLPNMARLIRPITALLKKGAAFDFTSAMENTVRALLVELAAPAILVYPDWDGVIDTTRPFRLHCDTSTAGLGATLEQEQPDGSIRPIVYISRASLDNEQNWTAMELKTGCVVWGIRRLRRYLFGVYNVGEKPTVILLLFLFLTFSVLVANPKKLLRSILHGGQSRSWSAEQGKESKIKSLAAYPPPHTHTHTARSEKVNKITRRIYRRYAGLGRSRVRTRVPSARRLGQWVRLRKILHSRLR